MGRRWKVEEVEKHKRRKRGGETGIEGEKIKEERVREH